MDFPVNFYKSLCDKTLRRFGTLRSHDAFIAPCLPAGVIQRWELLGAPKFTRDEADVKQGLEHWHKLNSDLSDVTSWLGRVLPELENLQRIEPSTRIGDFEVNIQRLKVVFFSLLITCISVC